MKYTKSHEKEERRLLKKGMARVWAALILCAVPVIGLFLAADGYLRVHVRLTKKHARRRRADLVLAFIVLLLCTGTLLGETWVYSRDPQVLNRLWQKVWTFTVGEENAQPAVTGAPESADDPAAYGMTDDGGDWFTGKGTADGEEGFVSEGEEPDWADAAEDPYWQEDGAWEAGAWEYWDPETGDFTGEPGGTDEDWNIADDGSDFWADAENFVTEEDIRWLSQEEEDGQTVQEGEETEEAEEAGEKLPTMYIGAGETIVPLTE